MKNDELTKRLLEIQKQIQAAAAKGDFVTVMQLSQEVGRLQQQAVKETAIEMQQSTKETEPTVGDMSVQEAIQAYGLGGISMQDLVKKGKAVQEAIKTQSKTAQPQTSTPGATKSSPVFTALSGGLKIIDDKYVEFGSFPQGKNGVVKKILWRVLENKNGQMLLLSEYVLACKKWQNEFTKQPVSWGNSDLRKWCNDYFYHHAFNSAEKSQIIERLNTKNGAFIHKDVINKVKSEYAKLNILHDDTYEKYQGIDYQDTIDKVFLLNVEEAIDYFKKENYIVPQTVWVANKDRAAKATDYALESSLDGRTYLLNPFDGETWAKVDGKKNQKIKVGEELIGSVSFWLRNAGSGLNKANAVATVERGAIFAGGANYFCLNFGVRPAVLIQT